MPSNQETALTVRLHELCELLHVSVHRPRLTFKVANAAVTVGEHTLNTKQVTTPSWKLMPAEMSAALDREENAVGRLIAQYAEPFRAPGRRDSDEEAGGRYQIRGLHMVPQRFVEDMLRRLAEHNSNMRAIVQEWAGDSSRFRDAIRRKLDNPALFEMAQKRIPSLGAMLESTSVDVVAIPFGLGMEQLKRAGAASFLAEARARTHDMVAQVTQQLVAGPRQELADAVTGLRELIEANGRVTSRSLNPVRAAFDKLRRFDFVADEALLAQMASLERHLDGITPAEQNSETATANGLLGALRSTAAAALDEARTAEQYQQVVGASSSRRITLRRPALAGA